MILPTLAWDDVQLPAIGIPELPVPDLWGTPAQWAVLLPALAALAGVVLPGRSNRLAAWTGVGGLLAGWVATLWQLYTLTQVEGRVRTSSTLGPLPLGELEVPLRLVVSWPSALVAVTVTSVALVVQAYARWYLWYDPRYRVFAATVSLFTAAMLLTVCLLYTSPSPRD